MDTPKPKRRPPAAGKGRPKGAVNKATREIREIAQSLFDEGYFAKVRDRLAEGKLAPAVECKLLAYAWGEPKQQVDLNANLKQTTRVVHEHRNA